MATTTEGRNGDEMDPQAQLAMLKTVQDATEAEAWMPPTPLWHAPVLATAIAGLALINDGPDGWAIPGAVIGAIAVAFGIVDQLRRRRASPRRIRKPLRAVAFYGFILVVTYCILAMWGAIDLPDSAGQAAPVAFGAWLATTMIFALGIAVTDRMRNRWTESPL